MPLERRRGSCACCRRASSRPSAGARRSRPTCASSPRRIAISNRRSPQGLFREDLFYRLNVVPIRIPPLRERLEDVGDLVRHFLRQAAREGLGQKSIEAAAIERLKAHPWPGNVRELENFVRRLAALYTQDTLTSQIIEQELAELCRHDADWRTTATPGLERAGRALSRRDISRRSARICRLRVFMIASSARSSIRC